MGKISKGILGGFQGTVGTVVGANWRGMDVIRSRPKSSGKPPTARQLLQREKFALAMKFQNSLRTMQSRLFGDYLGVKSRVNLAASYLLKEVVSEENGILSLRMEKVLITKGTLTGFQNLEVEAVAGGKLQYSWGDNSLQALAKITDIFCTAVYETDSEEFYVQEGPQQRSTGTALVTLPTEWIGKSVHVYAFLQNEEQNLACNSVYVGEILLT